MPFISFTVFKRAYDARKTSAIQLIYTIDAEVRDEAGVLKRLAKDKQIGPTPDMEYKQVTARASQCARTGPSSSAWAHAGCSPA